MPRCCRTRSTLPTVLQMFGFVDMTASDFLAAFLLAAQLQRCRRKAALQVRTHSFRACQSLQSCPCCMTVKVCRASSELQAAASLIHYECSCGCTAENSHSLGPTLPISLNITQLQYTPTLQHLAEDADVIDAEAGALSPVDSALSTFSSARSTLSSMHTSRRRMTSGGIADLEGCPLPDLAERPTGPCNTSMHALFCRQQRCRACFAKLPSLPAC